MLIVAIAMAAFLLLPLITNRLRLPDIIGILVAGILVGPHGLGLLERDETIQLLGTVGLLYLVFLAGLEVDLGDLSRKRGRAITFGVITFLVPQIVGTLGGLLLFDFGIATAVLLGSVFSSHSFLALLIAKRLRLTDREMSIAVIGGTVITDTLALFVLAVVAQSTAGSFGPLFLGRLLLQAVLFAAAVVFGLPFLGRYFFKRVNDGGAQFAFMMTVLFTCGFVAHLVGLEPIIGAFLAGLAMNRLVPHHGVLANRAFFVGNTIFVPFFLLSVGMLIDLRMVVSDVDTIVMALFMTFTVTVCKAGAAWIMRALFGYSREDAVVAWGLSLPQAATTLAVVLVGHDLGLFDDAILNATVIMVLVTCVLGPLLVEVAGRRIAAARTVAPVGQPAENTAFQRILIPLANPQVANDLLDLAAALRRPLNDEPLRPLSVASRASEVANSERLLEASVIHLAGAEVPVSAEIRVDPNPVNGILRAANELRVTSLIVGWSGPESHWQRHFHLNRGVIDELIVDTTGQLLVVRLTRPLSVIERVVLAVPQLAQAESGFDELIADCKLAIKRIGANLTVVGPAVRNEVVRERITAIKPSCPLTFAEAGEAVEAQIDAVVDPHTLVIIVGCREGSISWSGAWSRLVTGVAHRHQGISLAVAYPRIDAGTSSTPPVPAVTAPSLLERARFVLEHPADQLAELIQAGLPPRVPDTPLLLKRLQASLSVLHHQVALVHLSTAGVVQPDLGVVVAAQPVEHGELTVRVLLVLINPMGTSATRHLQNLASIARTLGQAARVEALLAAGDEAEARRALLAPVEEPDEVGGAD